MPKHAKYVCTRIWRPDIYFVYHRVRLFIKGSNNEIFVFKVPYVIPVSLKVPGTLPQKNQALTLHVMC